MRVLVCGGRDFFDAERVCSVLDYYHSQRPFSVVIHGNAPGADRSAGDWATLRYVPVQAFPAEWDLHGRAAGPIRNKQMLDEGKPEIVVAFPGRAGTRDMKTQARARNVPVLEIERV